ncbi:MAG: class I SAM-dependent methyltransferase [Dehalococcoidales bacterium]
MYEENFFPTKGASSDLVGLELSPRTKEYWKEKYEWAARKPTKYRRFVKMLLDMTKTVEGTKVLDVGCGVGAHIIEMSYHGANCVGIDALEERVHLINRVSSNHKLNLRAIYGDACKLPFDDETFDVVMSFQFFEHVSDLDSAINEQIRVLKKGGRLVIDQANLLDPFVLYEFMVKYYFRTRGRHSGLKWLSSKGKVVPDMYGAGSPGKDEDIHSRLWWRRKIKQYASVLIVNHFTSSSLRLRGKLFLLLAPLVGNIFIVATKK